MDGALEEARRVEVETHLKSCSACGEVLASNRLIEDTIRTVTVPYPSEQDWNRMWTGLKARREEEASRSWLLDLVTFKGRLTPAFGYGVYAVTLIAVLSLSIFLMSRGGPVELSGEPQCIVDSVESKSSDYVPMVFTVEEEDLTIIWVTESQL